MKFIYQNLSDMILIFDNPL